MRYFSVERGALRHNNFDFLRFGLALLVLFSHCWPLSVGGESTELLGGLTGGRFTLGRVAVAFFFIISGFLIAHSWMSQPRILPYLRKRVLRIYPGFAVTILLCAFLVVPLASAPGTPLNPLAKLAHSAQLTATLRMYIVPGTFTHNPYPNNVNSSLWTIRYEFLCYIGLMLLGLGGLLRKRWFVPAAVLAALIVETAWTAFTLWPHAWQVMPIPHGLWSRFVSPLARGRYVVTFSLYFLIGTAFYQYRDRVPYSHALAVAAAASLAASLFTPQAIAFTAALPLCGAYLVFYFAFSSWLPLQHFGKYGDFSYGIYTYAFPIQQLLAMWLFAGATGVAMDSLRPIKLFLLAAPLSIAAGALSWHLVEKHFLRRKNRPDERWAPKPAVVAVAEQVETAVSGGS